MARPPIMADPTQLLSVIRMLNQLITDYEIAPEVQDNEMDAVRDMRLAVALLMAARAKLDQKERRI